MAERKTSLRAVTEADISNYRAAQKPVMSVEEAAATGDQRDLLLALRKRVATTVNDPNCPPRDLAALSRRLQELGREIEALDAKAKQEAAESGDNRTPDEDWNAEAI